MMLQRYEKELKPCKERAIKSRSGVLRDNKGVPIETVIRHLSFGSFLKRPSGWASM